MPVEVIYLPKQTMAMARTNRGRRRRGRQLELNLVRGRGGPGRGQGRKKRKVGFVSHGKRPWHDRRLPVHVSTSVLAGLPSLRGDKLWQAVRQGFVHGCVYGSRTRSRCRRREQGGRVGPGDSERAIFRIVEFSVQGMHIHLVVEANSRQALSRGLQGFKIRVARAINKVLGRKGAVFKDRYHEKPISNPRQCRNTLLYVLSNQRHHAHEEGATYPRGTIDPCSSAPLFVGWTIEHPPTWAQAPPTNGDGLATVATPLTWLLRGGWKRGGGLLSASAVPGRQAAP